MDVRATGYAEWAILYIRTILKTCLGWFSSILSSLDMVPLWMGAVVFVIAFSVILLPLRGGSMLGGGAVSDFAGSRLSSSRRNSNKHSRNNSKKHGED